MYARLAFSLVFCVKTSVFVANNTLVFRVLHVFTPTPPTDVRHPPRPRSFPKFFLFFFRICALCFVSFYECFYFWVFYFVLLVLPLFAIMVYLRQYFCASDGLCHRWSFEAVCGVFRALLVVLAVRLSVYVFLR